MKKKIRPENGAVIRADGTCTAPPGTPIKIGDKIYVVNKEGYCEPEKKK